MDEIMSENTLDSKDKKSNNIGIENFESEVLNCVKEVVESISDKEKEGEEIDEQTFLNCMDNQNNSSFQINEKPLSEISALFEMATKNSSTEFEPFNPFCGFTSIREPCGGVVIPAVEKPVSIDLSTFKTTVTKIKTAVAKKKRRRMSRKRWIIKKPLKKNEAAVKPSNDVRTLNHVNDYAKLYESCLNFCQFFNEEVPSLSFSSSDGKPLPENELIVLMAKDLISKINEDGIKLTNEKKALIEKQETLLKTLVGLLQDKVVSNVKSETKKNLPPKLDKSRDKFDFCGFQSSKPQNLNKEEEETTLEDLFSYSPQPSPTHSFVENEDFSDSRLVPVPVPPNCIMDLDFVFKPLFNPFPFDSESVSPCSEVKEESDFKNNNLKIQVNTRSPNLTRGCRTTDIDAKVSVKNKKSKVALKRLATKKSKVVLKKVKAKKSKKLRLNVNQAFRRTKANTLTNTLKSSTLPSNNCNSNVLQSSNTNEGSGKISNGFSTGSFGAPNKTSLLNLRSSLRALPEVPKGNQVDEKSGLKRKFDKMSGKSKNRRINHSLISNSKFTVSFFPNLRSKSTDKSENIPFNNLRSKSTNKSENTPVDSLKSKSINKTENNPKSLQVTLAKTKLASAVTYPKVSVNGEAITLRQSTQGQKAHSESSESTLLYYPVHPFISHDLPVHFIPIDCKKIPPFLPLYSPVINSKNNSPIYPSFIRTIPAPNIKTPNDYVLSKGIKSKSIPIRSFSENKVKENIFPSIASTSKCPLIPEIKSLQSKPINKQVQSIMPNRKQSSHSPLVSETGDKSKNVPQSPIINIGNAITPLDNQIKPNQKIHKCQKCGFTTPKLGVLKRHELSHSQGQIPANQVIVNPGLTNNSVQNDQPKLSGVVSCEKQLPSKMTNAAIVKDRRSNPTATKLSGVVSCEKQLPSKMTNAAIVKDRRSNATATKFARNNVGRKALKIKKRRNSSEDSNSSFNGFTENSVRESFMKRFPGVTITPLYNPVKS